MSAPGSPTARPVTIGYQEYVALPEWGIDRLLAKSDTGARSSALDAKNIEELGEDRVRFDIALSRKNREKTVTVEADVVRRTRIRSSHGHTTDRLVVVVPLHVGRVSKPIEVTLVGRKRMICRMLLGRTALAETFLVDSGRRFVLSEPRRRRVTAKGAKSAKEGREAGSIKQKKTSEKKKKKRFTKKTDINPT